MQREALSNSNLTYKFAFEKNFGELIKGADEAKFQKFKLASSSISYSQNAVDSELFGGTRAPSKSSKGNVEVSGNIKIGVDNTQFGFWALALLGKYKFTKNFQGTKHKHSFTISKKALPSLQLEKSYAGSPVTYRTTGIKANTMSIEFGGEGEVYATIDMIGKNDFFYPYRTNSTFKKLAAAANLGATELTFADLDKLDVNDVITIKKELTTPAQAYNVYDTAIKLTSVASIAKNDFIDIENAGAYQVKAVVGDIVYLSRGLEFAITNTSKVSLVSQQVTIKSKDVAAKKITIDEPLKTNLAITDGILTDDKTSQLSYGTTFEQFDVTIKSQDNSGISSTVEKATINFNNNAEGKRLIKDKGSLGKITDGKVSCTIEMDLVLDPENALLLENAKNDTIFDLTLSAVNGKGDSISFVFAKGTLTPKSPSAESPGAVSVSLTYSPFEENNNEAVEIILINDNVTPYGVSE
jgi:hypothetical protein